MIYQEYEYCLYRYKGCRKKYDMLLLEAEEIFTKTQIKAINYDKDAVTGGQISGNTLENYILDKEKTDIDNRLTKMRHVLDERYRLLKEKEDELRKSQDLDDKIYWMRCFEHSKLHKIASQLSYSESQVSRRLRKMGLEVEED